MYKKVIVLFLVEFLSVLVYIQAERDDAVEHKVEYASVPSLLPQVLFEMNLMKHELMSPGTTMNGLENKLNNELSNIGKRLENLDAIDNVAEFKDVGKGDFQELKEEMFLLKKGFSREKQSLQKKVIQITQVMNTAMTELVLNVNQTITDKQDQLDYKFDRFTANVEKTLEETKDAISINKTKNGGNFRDLSMEQKADKAMIKSLSSKLDMLNKGSIVINSTYNDLLAKLERQKVAFSAYLGETTPELPEGSTIVFDKVIYQIGGGYDPKDGVFTCPETGVYLFNVVVDIANKKPKRLKASLYIDGQWKALVYSETHQESETNDMDQASNMVILSLYKGQRVWIETYGCGAVKVDRNFSTFSGALLYN